MVTWRSEVAITFMEISTPKLSNGQRALLQQKPKNTLGPSKQNAKKNKLGASKTELAYDKVCPDALEPCEIAPVIIHSTPQKGLHTQASLRTTCPVLAKL